MKHVLSIFFFFIALSTQSAAELPGTTQANKFVEYKSRLQSGKLKAGATGHVLISLKPRKGIHINLTPPMSVVFDSSAAYSSTGTMDIPRKGKTNYLDPSKTVSVPFSLAPSVAPGTTVMLHGTLIYYYCSDAEGWCSKFKQPMTLQCDIIR